MDVQISRKEFEEMYAAMTIAAMTKVLKCDRSTIYTYAKKYDLGRKVRSKLVLD